MMNRLLRILIVFALLFFVTNLFTIKPMLRRLYPLRYTVIIAEEASKRDVDPFLVAAIIQVESGWRPKAVSPKGATGLMQLMPDTSQWIAGHLQMPTLCPEDIVDPRVNIALGTWYIAFLREKFPSMVTALAAYNGGQGNVRLWLNTQRWDGRLETIGDIPFYETRRYVRRVLLTRDFYRRLYDYEWEIREEN